jgi:hypothetical protein
LARFCFISGRGRYEYLIEYEKRYGDLQLLLYYDDDSQWPAIYKTGKTCKEKISVLRPEDYQIVTLSAKAPFNIYSGCTLRPLYPQNPQKPTVKPKTPFTTNAPGEDVSYYDQFLKTSTSTVDPPSTSTARENDSNWELVMSNSTDALNSSASVSFISDVAGFENQLDTSTFEDDVEDMFEYVENVSEKCMKQSKLTIRLIYRKPESSEQCPEYWSMKNAARL